MSATLVSMRGLRKQYAGVLAVDDVTLDLAPGEIVGLVGKNGAGKSTIIKMLAGAVMPDAGQIAVAGAPARIASPHAAGALGLAFMHQELEQVPQLSVAENVMLGTRLPRRAHGPLISWRSLYARASDILAVLDDTIDPRARMDALSAAQKRLVLIARAIYMRARLLVLDEPTTSLTADEIAQLHDVLRGIRDDGGGVVYVSHRLDEIFALTDRVVVMRDGRVVHESATSSLDHRALVRAITGEQSTATVGRRRPDRTVERTAVPLLRVQGLARHGAVRPTSFDVHAGEIVGIAGLVGAGRTELLRLVFGADRASSGTVAVDGRALRLRSPRDAMRGDIALLPEDRRHEGLILDFGVRANLTLATLDRVGSKLPFFPSRPRESAAADELIRRLQIATPSREKPVRQLSGGNQQKAVVGKWLARDSRVLLFDEPTAGIDVGAKGQIYELIERLADDGRGIVFVSSEFSELVAVCDRILVMREGALVGELTGKDINERAVVAACYAQVDSTTEGEP